MTKDIYNVKFFINGVNTSLNVDENVVFSVLNNQIHNAKSFLK